MVTHPQTTKTNILLASCPLYTSVKTWIKF